MGENTSFDLPTSIAEIRTSDVIRQRISELRESLRKPATVEYSDLKNALQLVVDSGYSKTRAIGEVFGIRGGDKFAAVARWIDTAIEIRALVKELSK